METLLSTRTKSCTHIDHGLIRATGQLRAHLRRPDAKPCTKPRTAIRRQLDDNPDRRFPRLRHREPQIDGVGRRWTASLDIGEPEPIAPRHAVVIDHHRHAGGPLPGGQLLRDPPACLHSRRLERLTRPGSRRHRPRGRAVSRDDLLVKPPARACAARTRCAPPMRGSRPSRAGLGTAPACC